MMKFSYRIVSVILLACSLMMLYFYWNDDLLTWHNGKRSLRKMVFEMAQKKLPEKERDPEKVENPVISHADECSFGYSKAANADINTHEIFQEIDRATTKDRHGRHLGQPNAEKEDPSYTATNELPLKIILVPHSHNDPGWQKTLNGYFSDQTKPTLDNMVEKLAKFPNMTFVWAESVFLHMWYEDLDAEKQKQVKRLIHRGQLEIVLGSWVVPDEANPHFYAIIDQMIEGHQWLEKTIGVKPKNTWTLDPFGYSSTHPYLYKRAGFENMIILRVHEKLKENLQKKKALEFHWRQHWASDESTDIFTQMMPYKLYNIKHTCGPDHYICVQFDFRKIPGEWSESRAETITEHNVERQAKLLLGQYQKKANLFRHNVVLIPLGDDFRFDRNVEWDQQFKNYMLLFNYINRRKDWNVHARFGTLKDYFAEVQATIDKNPALKQQGFPSLKGDFFPYTDENNEYWSGYFTTRPYDKNLGREVEVYLRAAEILNSLALGTSIKRAENFADYNHNMDMLPQARQNLGLFQHHDAITGTARSFVVIDYEQKLKTALDIAHNVMRSAAAYLLKPALSPKPLELDTDVTHTLKMLDPAKKVIEFSHKGDAEVVLFNSIAQYREDIVRLTVPSDRVEVYDEEGRLVISQINPIWTSFSDMSSDVFELVFMAALPPLGLVKYRVLEVEGAPRENYAAYVRLYNAQEYRLQRGLRFNLMAAGGQYIVLENGALRGRFSPRSGLLHSVTAKAGSLATTPVNMEFLMYKSRGSGAYIFSPAGPAVDTEMSTRPVIRVLKGPVVSEIHVAQELVECRVRLYNTSGALGQAFEINNIVDLASKDNKELIMRFSTEIKHNDTFYTDLNAFHMVKRKRFQNLPPEANYYPTSAFAYLENEEVRLSVLSGQPLGVSSQAEGALEVMLDRRLQYDDQRGLGEGVWDNKRSPSRFFLLLERKEAGGPRSDPSLSFPSLLAHTLSSRLRNHVFTLIPPVQLLNVSVAAFSPMEGPLPCDIELVNLRSLDIATSHGRPGAALLLHRVGYQCGFPTHGLHRCHTSNGRLSVRSLFSAVTFTHVQETSLSLMFNKTAEVRTQLQPMEIYAFKVSFK